MKFPEALPQKRGAIHNRDAYAQGKFVDCSGWANREKYGDSVLPRNITPSDIDVVFNPGTFMLDNAGHVMCIELSSSINIWSQASRGQYLAAQSLVKAGQGKIASAIAFHRTPVDQDIDLRESVESFSLMYFAPPTYACSDVFVGNERWQRFVLAWFANAEHTLQAIRR